MVNTEDAKTLAKEISNIKPFVYMQNTTGKKGRRKTIVGIISDGRLSLGIATCCRQDKFNSEIGLRLAKDRANTEPNLVFKLAPNQDSRKAFRRIVNSVL